VEHPNNPNALSQNRKRLRQASEVASVCSLYMCKKRFTETLLNVSGILRRRVATKLWIHICHRREACTVQCMLLSLNRTELTDINSRYGHWCELLLQQCG